MTPTPVFIDCEFLPYDLTPTGLISLSVIIGDERYYAVNLAMDIREVITGPNSKFNLEHVWPHLPTIGKVLDESHEDVKAYDVIRREVAELFDRHAVHGDADLDYRLIANRGSSDAIRLGTLWNNNWGLKPKTVPGQIDYDISTMKRDLELEHGVVAFPVQDPATAHHALHDALYDQEVYEFIVRFKKEQMAA